LTRDTGTRHTVIVKEPLQGGSLISRGAKIARGSRLAGAKAFESGVGQRILVEWPAFLGRRVIAVRPN